MPNRILKESICESDEIDKLSWFEEVFFYRLIVNCDDYGVLDARPKILKAKCFPLKDIPEKQIRAALNGLSTVGLVDLYERDDRPFLQLATWARHQQIRAKKSKYPTPDINCNQMISNDINCNQMISNDIKCSRNPIQYNSIQSNTIQSESESNPNQNPNPNIYEGNPNPYRPDPDDVREFILVKNYHFSVDEFMEYYDAVDWKQHGEPIKNWMSKCSVFERNWKKAQERQQHHNKPANVNIPMPDYIREQTKTNEVDFDSLPGGMK